ncbi:carboxyl-terminal processing protease [Clostridium algifaecis]|uniref:Carboxyl-terminal processing protease n=1 Tax=Clostridium algifaecis TaxID=1472040 RepID=A0ABS4KTX7_9CLOT|nr:S41 family peptidase [Clostridium algifaecis]MBP2033495.1 carboxyl-terminal processing protease [Clostridium algifaecis]
MKKNKKWVLCTIAIVVITNLITMFGTFNFWRMREGNALSKFEKIFEVRNTLYKYYDGAISDDALLEGALKGMTASLNDPYTVFMNKNEFDALNSETEGKYSGIGIQVTSSDNKIKIDKVFKGTPSEKVGLKAKDIIEKVNGTAVNGNELDKAVAMMKGKEGTEITLTIFRENKGSFDVKVKREKVNMQTVTGDMVSSSVGYIQVSMFDENTAKNFKNELDTLESRGMKSVIIDLRDNPGGVLDQCVDMVSNFVPKGKVVVSTNDKYNNKKEYKSKGGNFYNLPVTILTNGNTASASEIFSGAIKDYKKGTLVGEKTFGKGVVQTMFDTGDGTALKVTISKWYTPNGDNVQKKGIKPDTNVVYPDSLKGKPYDRSIDPQFVKALEIAQSKLQ